MRRLYIPHGMDVKIGSEILFPDRLLAFLDKRKLIMIPLSLSLLGTLR